VVNARRHNLAAHAAPSGAGLFGYVRQVAVLNVVIGCALAAAVVGYLVMNTQAATRAFVITSMEQEIATLEDKQQELDATLASGQSMDKVQEMVRLKGFVPVTSVEYIGQAGGPVASR
jgi:hypothetical protein